MSVRIMPDGLRVYDHGGTYRLMPDELRQRKRRKPDPFLPGTVSFHGVWFEPLKVLKDEERTMPRTVSDEDASDHRIGCQCMNCGLPSVRRMRMKRILATRSE